jgi:hypothetical protein
MKKVLVLQPYLDQSIGIAKFLRHYSNEFYLIAGLIDEKPSHFPMSIYHKTKRIRYEDLVADTQFDIVLPTGAQSTYNLLSRIKSIKIGNIIFNKENLQLFNKREILPLIEKMEIPIPKTFENIDLIEKYPVFYKQAFEKGSGSRGIAYSREKLLAIDSSDDLIFQEYINSPETYGVGFLAHEGRLITFFIHKEIMSLPKAGGSGVVLTTYSDKRLLTYTRRILNHFKYSGWGLVEFKYCNKKQDYVFMEVNAKFWASIEFALYNNPKFLKNLFEVDYTKENIDCVLFCNRLASYGFREYFKYIKQFKKCKQLYFGKSLPLLLSLLWPYMRK